MKKLLMAFLLLFIAGVAMADVPMIGIWADENYTHCYGDAIPYEPLTMFATAYIGDEFSAITAAEFRVDNWMGNPGYPEGTATVVWNTDLVIGTIGWGIALAFPTPVPGPFCALGVITVLDFGAGWIDSDHLLELMPSLDSDFLGVVDADFNTWDAFGGRYTLNCTDISFCCCTGSMSSPVENSDFSSIKALY